MKRLFFAALASLAFSSQAIAIDRNDLMATLQDYMEMAPFGDGVIMPAQLAEMKNDVVLVDTRQAADYAKHHIPGAMNIDWRFVMSELDKLPQDKMIVLYCDTGILSSKAHFALRLVGYEQVRVLFNGLNGWHAHLGR